MGKCQYDEQKLKLSDTKMHAMFFTLIIIVHLSLFVQYRYLLITVIVNIAESIGVRLFLPESGMIYLMRLRLKVNEQRLLFKFVFHKNTVFEFIIDNNLLYIIIFKSSKAIYA